MMEILDVRQTCQNCRFNDGVVYMSNPQKYKCTFDNQYREGLHKCHLDLVPVVRCKDCEACEMCYPEKQIDKEATPGWYCKKHKSYRRPDDFCSYGERREGE